MLANTRQFVLKLDIGYNYLGRMEEKQKLLETNSRASCASQDLPQLVSFELAKSPNKDLSLDANDGSIGSESDDLNVFEDYDVLSEGVSPTIIPPKVHSF